MAKKEENFDFETEGKGTFSLDLSFFTNLTKQQKGIILIAAVALVLVIAIVVTVVLVGANNGGSSGTGNGGSNSGGVSNGESNGEDEVPETLTMFNIATPPSKTTYRVGESASYDGLEVYFRDENGKSHYLNYKDDPDAFTFSGFDSSVPVAEQIITVECRGFTDTFVIEVKAVSVDNPILVSITVTPPDKTTYKVGKPLNIEGGKITANYENGESVTVDMLMSNISGYASIAYIPGEHEIKVVYYDDFGGYAETTFTVTITE